MNNIDDNTSISTLSIPGTHDSATYSCTCLAIPKISQCQVMNFYEQLQSGIRYLDIRIKTKNGEILMVHGIIELQSF